MNSRFLIRTLMIMTSLFVICSSCSKDEKDDTENGTTFKDRDGNLYHTVTIGTQVWMVENLRVTTYRNGDQISLVTDGTQWGKATAGAYCNYNNDINYVSSYGHLYNWYAVNDNRKIAPNGWHVPNDAEWATLFKYLEDNGYAYGGSGGDITKSMAAKSGWTTNTIAGNTGNDQATNNSCGFTALPGGSRLNNGTFTGILNYGYWWSSTDGGKGLAHSFDVFYDFAGVHGSNDYIEDGFSVRCLKD
jgi:uncharacterized protein (TIGR02145 family)